MTQLCNYFQNPTPFNNSISLIPSQVFLAGLFVIAIKILFSKVKVVTGNDKKNYVGGSSCIGVLFIDYWEDHHSKMIFKFLWLVFALELTTIPIYFQHSHLFLLSQFSIGLLLHCTLYFNMKIYDLKLVLSNFLMSLQKNVSYSYNDLSIINEKYIMAKTHQTMAQDFSFIDKTSLKLLDENEDHTASSILKNIQSLDIESCHINNQKEILYNNRFSRMTIRSLNKNSSKKLFDLPKSFIEEREKCMDFHKASNAALALLNDTSNHFSLFNTRRRKILTSSYRSEQNMRFSKTKGISENGEHIFFTTESKLVIYDLVTKKDIVNELLIDEKTQKIPNIPQNKAQKNEENRKKMKDMLVKGKQVLFTKSCHGTSQKPEKNSGSIILDPSLFTSIDQNTKGLKLTQTDDTGKITCDNDTRKFSTVTKPSPCLKDQISDERCSIKQNLQTNEVMFSNTNENKDFYTQFSEKFRSDTGSGLGWETAWDHYKNIIEENIVLNDLEKLNNDKLQSYDEENNKGQKSVGGILNNTTFIAGDLGKLPNNTFSSNNFTDENYLNQQDNFLSNIGSGFSSQNLSFRSEAPDCNYYKINTFNCCVYGRNLNIVLGVEKVDNKKLLMIGTIPKRGNSNTNNKNIPFLRKIKLAGNQKLAFSAKNPIILTKVAGDVLSLSFLYKGRDNMIRIANIGQNEMMRPISMSYVKQFEDDVVESDRIGLVEDFGSNGRRTTNSFYYFSDYNTLAKIQLKISR